MQLSDEEKKWLLQTMKKNQDAIDGSAMFLSLYSNEYKKDPVAVIQFGLAVLQDKPIYILCRKGEELSENVKRVAMAIEYFDPEDINDMKEKTNIIAQKAQIHMQNK